MVYRESPDLLSDEAGLEMLGDDVGLNPNPDCVALWDVTSLGDYRRLAKLLHLVHWLKYVPPWLGIDHLYPLWSCISSALSQPRRQECLDHFFDISMELVDRNSPLTLFRSAMIQKPHRLTSPSKCSRRR